MSRRVLVAALLACALAASCSSSGHGDAGTSSPSSSTSTTTAAPSTFRGVGLVKFDTAEQPTAMTWCPDGTAYVAERTGRVRRLPKNDQRPVIDVSGDLSLFGEQGLLGLACAPDGTSMVVSYTNRAGDTRIVAYPMPDPSAGTPRTLLAVHQLGVNHNGGNIVFGPDGRLWVGLGDGGGPSSERFTTSQDRTRPLGKILRLDLADPEPEVMVSGLRNPWRWSFDLRTDDLWIGDVGENAIEEIDRLPAGHIKGANLGWPAFEGSKRFRSSIPAPDDAIAPVFEYGHDRGRAVVGGYVYRGQAIPELEGSYLFTDTYRPRIEALEQHDGEWRQRTDIDVAVSNGMISSFAEDPGGELYVLTLGGEIFRLEPVGGPSKVRVDLTRRPSAPATAEDATSMLAGAESLIHDTRRAPDGSDILANAGHLEQVAIRTIAEHPGWDERVLAELPDEWDRAMRDDVAATRELRALVANPRPDLPAWRIVAPAPASELRQDYEDGEHEHGVPWQYLASVHLVETKMGRIRGASTAGALGPMQFLPSTWSAYGKGDIESNHDSIVTAARYLAANGAPRDMHGALFHYNHSEHYVTAVRLFAERMRADPLAYRGYYGWQVYYWSTLGDVWLRVGWSLASPRPVSAADLL